MMDKDKFFELIRPIFGKLNSSQVDELSWAFEGIEQQLYPLPYVAYALATVFHETARTMKPIIEYGSRSYFDKYEPGTKIGANLGNTKKGDGYLYRGRGYVQLTGRRNYAFAGDKLKVPLLAEPDLACDREVARAILRDGMVEGWFTGKKSSDYLDKRPADYRSARRIINGLDKADLIADYAKQFERALKGSGYAK
jgi:predicted chitinase